MKMDCESFDATAAPTLKLWRLEGNRIGREPSVNHRVELHCLRLLLIPVATERRCAAALDGGQHFQMHTG
jgi:hypothetical protein